LAAVHDALADARLRAPVIDGLAVAFVVVGFIEDPSWATARNGEASSLRCYHVSRSMWWATLDSNQ
jgi:hypothetical protein